MLTEHKIIIGSRGSQLALCQAEMVAAGLMQNRPGLVVEINKIKTRGDKILDVPLAKIGGQGLFVKELEDALLDGRIDLAVHSLKDVPTELPAGLYIGAITKRENPHDVIISRDNLKLEDLPAEAVIGTSSLRRQAQLRHYANSFRFTDLRGNLDTRIRKLAEQKLDAIIVAAAGLYRLGLEAKISQQLPIDICLPAVGQGALGIEIRENDERLKGFISGLHHPETSAAVTAERALLKKLEGGCQVPLGAYAELDNNTLKIQGVVADPQGRQIIKAELSGSPDEAAALGVRLAEKLLAAGGREILAAIYREAQG